MLEFLSGGPQASDDIEVHTRLLALVEKDPAAEATGVLVDLLKSDWRISGQLGVAFPLRYSAAWALVDRIGAVLARSADIPMKRLEHAASHSDDYLAAPALVALASFQEEGLAAALRALQSKEAIQKGGGTAGALRRALALLVDPATQTGLMHTGFRADGIPKVIGIFSFRRGW